MCGWSRTRTLWAVFLLQIVYLALVALLPLDYFLRRELFLYGGIVGGVAGGLLLGPLPVGYDRTLKFGSVLYGSLGATVVGTLGFHAVRFGYILVTQWSGYPIVQVRSTGVYIVTLSRSGLVFYVVVEMGRYAFAVVLTALVASTLGYAIGDVVKRRYGTRPADRIGGE
jgi:hypothetical protein